MKFSDTTHITFLVVKEEEHITYLEIKEEKQVVFKVK